MYIQINLYLCSAHCPKTDPLSSGWFVPSNVIRVVGHVATQIDFESKFQRQYIYMFAYQLKKNKQLQ